MRVNRTGGVVSTDSISMMRTHSTLDSAANPATPTRTQGHVNYSGKAVHRLGQNEGLSPLAMFRSNQVVLSARRHMSRPPGSLLTYPSHSIRTTSREGLANGPTFASRHMGILLV